MPLAPSVGDQVLHQVVSSLKMQWKDGIGEAKLHLRPDALGAVSVSLRVEAGAVTAVVRADSPQVQEWVVQHQQTLRQQMEAAGLRLDELVVTPDDQPQGGRPEGRAARAASTPPVCRASHRRADLRTAPVKAARSLALSEVDRETAPYLRRVGSSSPAPVERRRSARGARSDWTKSAHSRPS